jgi:hypothetical protein
VVPSEAADWFDRRRLRRAAAVRLRRCGCLGLVSGEMRGRTNPCVVGAARVESREEL